MATKVDADYPTSVWDQLSASRPDAIRNAEPDYHDWDKITAEVVAIETELESMKYLDLVNASGGALVPGNPVYNKTDASGVAAADCNAAVPIPFVLGLLKTGGASLATVRIQTRGNLTLTLAEWDAVGLTSAGLVANTTYYLSPTAGEITATKPATTGDHVVIIGVALSTTTMRIDPKYCGVSA